MMRSITCRLLRKTLVSSRVSLLASKQHQTLFYSSSSSSSSTLTELIRHISPLTSLRFVSSSSSSAAKNVAADEKLRKVIESEIECAQSDAQDQGVLPSTVPFEIIDNPGEQTITLKREFAGESIQVEVHMPDMDGENDEQDEDDDDYDDDDAEEDKDSGHFNISLIVTVVKGDGPRLEFSCTANPDEITIDSMLMKDPNASPDQIPYEGPEFSDLDENLQKAFYTYLEERGIESSLTNFLQEYMMNKDNREYLTWLKSMKEFVEK